MIVDQTTAPQLTMLIARRTSSNTEKLQLTTIRLARSEAEPDCIDYADTKNSHGE
jgi:hypothetical protein